MLELFYQIWKSRDVLKATFEETIANARLHSPESFAFGMVT